MSKEATAVLVAQNYLDAKIRQQGTTYGVLSVAFSLPDVPTVGNTWRNTIPAIRENTCAVSAEGPLRGGQIWEGIWIVFTPKPGITAVTSVVSVSVDKILSHDTWRMVVDGYTVVQLIWLSRSQPRSHSLSILFPLRSETPTWFWFPLDTII